MNVILSLLCLYSFNCLTVQGDPVKRNGEKNGPELIDRNDSLLNLPKHRLLLENDHEAEKKFNMQHNFKKLERSKNAFVCFFYDYGRDSSELLLLVRVLMQSILYTRSTAERIVVVSSDGASSASMQILKKDGITVIVSPTMENAFKTTGLADPIGQLKHAQNRIVLWDDSELRKFDRIVYLEPESVLLKNMDEVFQCGKLCAVDNGQSIVYSNSLLIVTPEDKTSRNVVEKAILEFSESGKEYGYTGILQGFIPGLFEVFEEAPLFLSDNKGKRVTLDDSTVKRLPFYYSINHMVYYERLNWDLYQCNNPNPSDTRAKLDIPGPLLSYKYTGGFLKPSYWVPYVYFNIFWYWMQVRDTLGENHFQNFLNILILYGLLFSCAWFAFFYISLKVWKQNHFPPELRHCSSLPVARRRTSSFNSNKKEPSITSSQWLSILSTILMFIDSLLCNDNGENILYTKWKRCTVSAALVVLIFIVSVTSIPNTMHPLYACKLWVFMENACLLSVMMGLYTVRILYTFRMEFQLGNFAYARMISAFAIANAKKLVLVLISQLAFLAATNPEYYSNPVQKPVVLILLISIIFIFQGRIIYVTMKKARV